MAWKLFFVLCLVMYPMELDALFFGEYGCETFIDCLITGNKLFPYRLNFNPITAYDRIKSHWQGRKGWTKAEMEKFEAQRHEILRIRAREDAKNRVHWRYKLGHRSKIQHWKERLKIFKETNMTYPIL